MHESTITGQWLPIHIHENAWEAGSCMEIHSVHTNLGAHSTWPTVLMIICADISCSGNSRYSLQSLSDRDTLGKDDVRNKDTSSTQNTRNQFSATWRFTWQEILVGNGKPQKKRKTQAQEKGQYKSAEEWSLSTNKVLSHTWASFYPHNIL